MMPLLPEYSLTRVDTVHCCSAEILLNALATDSIDLIVTSPPYGNLRTYNGFTWDFERIARESYRVLKPGGVLVWIVGDATINGSETLTSFRQALYFKDVVGFRMHDTMIYQKDMTYPETTRYYPSFEYMFVLSKGAPKTTNLIKNRPNKYAGKKISKTQRKPDGTLEVGIGQREGRAYEATGVLLNIWYFSSGFMKGSTDKIAYQHPAAFPEKLAERHILTWSNPGDLVLDYFMGSGTTAKMARKNGRCYVGCDISAEYVAIARQRLAQPYTLPMFERAAVGE